MACMSKHVAILMAAFRSLLVLPAVQAALYLVPGPLIPVLQLGLALLPPEDDLSPDPLAPPWALRLSVLSSACIHRPLQ